MREILFRGKRIDNGDWVYGAYITMHHNDGRTHIHHFIIPDGSDLSYGVKVEDILVEVDVKTVCQCTGLKDKTGRKIFEGDIVKYDRYIGKIVFISGEYKIKWNEDVYFRSDMDFWCNDDDEKIQIVGNVFDNPELLENGKE